MIHTIFRVIAACCHMVTNHRRLNVLSELIHRCVGNTHVPEHALHFGSVETTTFCLWRK